jgi:hypothetical protein
MCVSLFFSFALRRRARFDIARSQNTAAYCTPEPESGWLVGRVTGPLSLSLSLCAFANCFQSVAILKGEHASFTIQQQN